MSELICEPAVLPSSIDQPAPDPDNLWAVVLAGGEGMRLRPVTRLLYGDDRPKQFAALVGARSLLRQTLDRLGGLIPREPRALLGGRAPRRAEAARLGAAL